MKRFLRFLLAGAIALATPSLALAAFDQEDLVCETTTATGTGRTTINLSGSACTNYLTFAAGGVASGDTVTYTMVSGDNKIETGYATFTDAAPDTLTSITVLASSDGVGTALSLTGTTDIYLQWNSHSFNGGVGLFDIDDLTANSITGVSSIDATTESTIEGAIDTLANLTTIQGLTDTRADAGADAVFGWDDTASAYENLTAGEVRAIIGDPLAVANGGTGQTTEAEALGEMTQALTADGSPDRDADYVMTYDASADTGKKVLLEDVSPHTMTAQIFTATGTYTPTTGAVSFKVRCQASGGGGGGADSGDGNANIFKSGAGGGGGQYAEIWYDTTEMGATASVTIGAVGTAGSTSGGDGGAGTDSSFNPAGTGATLTVDGGGGGGGTGASATSGYGCPSIWAPGQGGSTASGGDFEVDGEDGMCLVGPENISGISKQTVCGGDGGAAHLGFGANNSAGAGCGLNNSGGTDYTGTAGQSYGGGGSGGIDTDTAGSAGGAGGAGICIVEELIATP